MVALVMISAKLRVIQMPVRGFILKVYYRLAEGRCGGWQFRFLNQTLQHIRSDNIGSADFDKCPILLARLISVEISNNIRCIRKITGSF